ncbi:hypothetical protein IV88_GL000152 [Pediococcus argentinicus]|uniref:Uncharacterized protein n=2 Tax=Pediococcus argentinicus TaxID=480391 RepID=A0A0R2NHZ2_9LACO|nr:hypothetical protein IV88_GL000152 [Pediococcus argentinicus]
MNEMMQTFKKIKTNKAIFWGIVVIITSVIPAIFQKSSLAYALQALISIIALSQIMKK